MEPTYEIRDFADISLKARRTVLGPVTIDHDTNIVYIAPGTQIVFADPPE